MHIMISRFDTNMMNHIILPHLLPKIQNDHHMLKFYLTESCKSLNNSQLYRFYHMHISIQKGDILVIQSVFTHPL
jgi:hypothetical protein